MSRRRPFDRARRRLYRPRRQSGERLAHRLDRAAYKLNPYLLAVAIGLAVLTMTFFVAIKVSSPRPMPSAGRAIAVPFAGSAGASR